LREFCSLFELMLANTFQDNMHTYFHFMGNTSSRIDFIAVSQSASDKIRSCQVLRKSGMRLQRIRDWKPRDHLPVCIDVDISVLYSGATPPMVRWNWQKISRMVNFGEGRR
jgi:hypothetical protein